MSDDPGNVPLDGQLVSFDTDSAPPGAPVVPWVVTFDRLLDADERREVIEWIAARAASLNPPEVRGAR